jgi:hypothetical protein
MSVPTATEFLMREDLPIDFLSGDDVNFAMIEFAKLHVEAALKEASKKAQIKYEYSGNVGEYCDEFVDINSILNSYPLDKIK